MGKKSRLKNERRRKKLNLVQRQQDARNAAESRRNLEIRVASLKLEELFSHYRALDVIIAINISDLWILNISAQIRHQFLFIIVLSMQLHQFKNIKKIETYSDFASFLDQAYEILPKFILEDFVPEGDWGNTHVDIGLSPFFPKIFGGGFVERISDYIEAFRILFTNEKAALQDMERLTLIQNHLISHIDPHINESHIEITLGNIEIPPEVFWHQTRNTMMTLNSTFPLIKNTFSQGLIVELGSFDIITSSVSFDEAIIQGSAFPVVFIRLDDKLIPVSIRNAASVVIDYWSNKIDVLSTTQLNKVIINVSRFLTHRFGDNIIEGPMIIHSKNNKLDTKFAAIIRSKLKIYLVLLITPTNLADLKVIEDGVNTILSSNEDWGFILEKENQYFQIKNQNGLLPKILEIEILAVIISVRTCCQFIDLPKTKARVIYFPDFISIFDSINNTNEYSEFLHFLSRYSSYLSPMNGLFDAFAAFYESHSLLIDGAIEPDHIALDPHWGSNWRYRFLKKFWRNAPYYFPNGQRTWELLDNNSTDNLIYMKAKGENTYAWSTNDAFCTIQAVGRIENIDEHNNSLVHNFCQLIADAIEKRKLLLFHYFDLFQNPHIVINCHPNFKTLVPIKEELLDDTVSIMPIIEGWRLNYIFHPNHLVIDANINLALFQSRLLKPIDARFEVECLIEIIEGISRLLNLEVNPNCYGPLINTASNLPRFVFKKLNRVVDVPTKTYGLILPDSQHFKMARRDLAVILKRNGILPSTKYELSQSKKIIDDARNILREEIHLKLLSIDKNSLLITCVVQNDKLINAYKMAEYSLKISVNHDVSFDRISEMSKQHHSYIKDAKNIIYLLESCYSLPAEGSIKPSDELIKEILALIDWLMVLYSASDVLHNEVSIAGIKLNEAFIPEIFYSSDHNDREKMFSHEQATFNLGINLESEDRLKSILTSDSIINEVNNAFIIDLGFSFIQMTRSFQVLCNWFSLGNSSELAFSYESTSERLLLQITKSLPDITPEQAKKLIQFLTLDDKEMLRLYGKKIDEVEIPIWEHNKRGNRYTLRPILKVESNLYAWGALAAQRAAAIWEGSMLEGYLPTEGNWPNINKVMRAIKENLEKQLENKAFDICSRTSEYVIKGIDFKKKFPNEKLEDVGDYDVLMYLPTSNRWLLIECKYNKPPFCIKDARRLREKIFGPCNDGKPHLEKMHRRLEFLMTNIEKLRSLLGWPLPAAKKNISFTELYVSKEIYWWMRNPPYITTVQFTRIDALKNWLDSWMT